MNKAQRWFWRLLSLPLAAPLFLACYLARPSGRGMERPMSDTDYGIEFWQTLAPMPMTQPVYDLLSRKTVVVAWGEFEVNMELEGVDIAHAVIQRGMRDGR